MYPQLIKQVSGCSSSCYFRGSVLDGGAYGVSSLIVIVVGITTEILTIIIFIFIIFISTIISTATIVVVVNIMTFWMNVVLAVVLDVFDCPYC